MFALYVAVMVRAHSGSDLLRKLRVESSSCYLSHRERMKVHDTMIGLIRPLVSMLVSPAMLQPITVCHAKRHAAFP